MRPWLMISVAALSLAGVADMAPARAQVIQRPGAAPIYVNPGQGGGYAIQQPGQSPIYVNPGNTGGYVVQAPGLAPADVNPNDAGVAAPASRHP